MFKFVQKSVVQEAAVAPSTSRLTVLLSLLLLLAGTAVVVMLMRLENSHDGANAAQRDLEVCRRDLSELAQWQSIRTTGAPVNSSDPALNRRLTSAAMTAGISGELASIEPGQPVRVRDTDYSETPVYLRLNAVTLRQVAGFLTELSSHDTAVRAKTIELSPPQTPPQPQSASERWTTDITLAYQTYSPRGREEH